MGISQDLFHFSQTLKKFTYFYMPTQANFTNLGEKLKTMIPQVKKAVADAHATGTGSLVLIYHNVTEDPAKNFDLEVGFPIEAKVTPGEEYKVREVDDYPCMSVLFSGSLMHLSSAFEKLLPAAMAAGTAKPTNEVREMYLYFEAFESPNNVVHISVGMK